MKYITSCPKCDTQFLLNDELIKAHRGKVQCGSCELIFNAKTRLTEVADEINSAEQYQAIVEENEQVEEIILGTESESNIDETSHVDYFLNDITTSIKESKSGNEKLEINTTPMVDDFINNRSKQKKSTKHINKIWLVLFSLLLILTAIFQTIYNLRVRVAAEYPQFKPLIVKACEHLKCTVGLPKDLNLITIGDSDMQEDDNYQSLINFTSVIKNNASYPQAYPNIELTLTNTNDQVEIKKIISAKDYLNDDAALKEGMLPNDEKRIKLALYVDDGEVAGYRILLLY
jgi:predicted Zn finger-like uncharacterized protein